MSILRGEALHQERVTAISRATGYMYGRQDAGETWDTNVIWNFSEAYGDRAVKFHTEQVASMPPLDMALKTFLERGVV